jgi:hypothetical protein
MLKRRIVSKYVSKDVFKSFVFMIKTCADDNKNKRR